jgi:glycosyltransferase involved in cell wall biosynthesis
MHQPRVSVFIASYNHAPFIRECLDSILAQTYQDFEIVIVDDGSTDDSHEILMDYQRRFPEIIRYLWHPGHANKGISITCNLALENTKGEYLAWTGSDDIWYPDKLEQQIAQLDAHTQLGFVYSYAQPIDICGNRLPGLYGLDITKDPNPMARMIQACHPPAMTIVIRRKCLDEVGFFDETLVYSDWDLWIRVLAHWKAGFLNKPLAMYRIHGQNLSKRIDPHVDLQRILDVMKAVQRKSTEIGGSLIQPRNLALQELQIAFLLFCSGQDSEAIQCLQRAFEQDLSLANDSDYFNEWLNSWKGDFYSVSHCHFGFWAIAHLSPTCGSAFHKRLTELQLAEGENLAFFVKRGIQQGLTQPMPSRLNMIFEDCPKEISLPPAWRSRVLKEAYAALLFETAKTRDLSKVRYYWAKTIQYNPAWLLNRGVWSIGLRAFFAPRLLTSS